MRFKVDALVVPIQITAVAGLMVYRLIVGW
jgi:hypothetical protein